MLSPCAPNRVIKESCVDPAGPFPGDHPGVFLISETYLVHFYMHCWPSDLTLFCQGNEVLVVTESDCTTVLKVLSPLLWVYM